MKKFLALLSVLVLSMSMLVGCGSKSASNDELVVYFVPSRDPAEILEATKPLSEMLKAELSKLGYDFKKVKIEVGTSFEAVGEALSSGTAQVGFIPGGTYVLYDDGVDVALTATRFGLNHDSENPADWNTSPTENTDKKVKYYRSLIIAGPSEKGQELAANYATSLSQLASGQIDVMVTYADARLDYAEQWNSNFGRTASIWDETNVIGVTDGVYNDTISVTKDSSMTPELKKAIQQAFINIGNTEEGLKIISIYSHKGYEIGNNSDYDAERKAQELIKSMQ